MIAGIMLFLQALPQFLELINRLGTVMDRLVKTAGDHNLAKWLDGLEAQIDNLEKAKTPDEKLNAASGLVDAIRHIH